MAILIVQENEREREIPLQGSATIGRHPSNTVRLACNVVSKYHAIIREVDGTFTYEDLGSSNGSYFHELRIQEHEFNDGDEIRVGNVLIRFKESEFDDVSSLVQFEQFDPQQTQYAERIDVAEVGRFLPENEVHDAAILRVDYEKLRLGEDLLESIGIERDVRKLLNTITEKLVDMFVADRCVVLLLNPKGEFEPRAVKTQGNDTGKVFVSQTVLDEVKSTKSAVLLSDESHTGELAQSSSLVLMGIQSVMCSPIIHNDNVIGAVQIDLRKGQGAFVKKDLQLLGGIVTYVAMAVANAGLSQKIEREAKTQAQFERLLSPSIVRQLVSGQLKIGKAGELRQVTIMFADIRGFTAMSQKASPAVVVNMLNQYFERVVCIAFKYGGTIDKFIGDEVMILFGAPIPMKKQEDSALACALEIQVMLRSWNKERGLKRQVQIPVGIGINSGEVVVGSIGSSQTMQYTCIGNAVNIASRLTNMARAGEIVVSKATMVGVQSEVECDKLAPASIKGIDGQVQAYRVKAIHGRHETDTVDE
ncbi:MAG: adenylate/guanylate cyclase domain-containing protein [Ghiorsea sp.]|nr:adenylate/guanylate cyclase domain-containing protein [Ghiorsea sp.]